jgi:hypothetical protein
MTTSSDPSDNVDNVVDTDLDEYGYYEYTLPEHRQGKHSFFRNFQQSRGDNTDINDDDEDDDASISSASFSSSHRGGGKRGSVNNNNVTVSNLDNYPESTCILRCVRCVVLILLLSLMAVLSIVCFFTGTDNDDNDDERVRVSRCLHLLACSTMRLRKHVCAYVVIDTRPSSPRIQQIPHLHVHLR